MHPLTILSTLPSAGLARCWHCRWLKPLTIIALYVVSCQSINPEEQHYDRRLRGEAERKRGLDPFNAVFRRALRVSANLMTTMAALLAAMRW